MQPEAGTAGQRPPPGGTAGEQGVRERWGPRGGGGGRARKWVPGGDFPALSGERRGQRVWPDGASVPRGYGISRPTAAPLCFPAPRGAERDAGGADPSPAGSGCQTAPLGEGGGKTSKNGKSLEFR